MELLSTWRSLYKLRYCPVTLVQPVFSAGTVYLLIAMQASSGTRIAQKELRHALDQGTLVQQYLQEIGSSWNCATTISATLRNLMTEQVRPLLDLMDRRNIPTNSGLHISADIGNDEGNNASRSRSSSPERSVTKLAPETSHPHTLSSGSGQSSLPTQPNHIFSTTFPTLVPPPAKPSISPTIAISSASNASSTHVTPNFTGPSTLQPSSGSNPNLNYLPSSSAHPEFAQASSNPVDNPFSENANSSGDDVENALGSLVSYLSHNFHPSPSSEYLGMLGGQTLPEEPFVGFLGGVDGPNSSNSLQAPFGTDVPNHASSSTSLGDIPSSSRGGNDIMDLDSVDLDSVPWRQAQAFAS